MHINPKDGVLRETWQRFARDAFPNHLYISSDSPDKKKNCLSLNKWNLSVPHLQKGSLGLTQKRRVFRYKLCPGLHILQQEMHGS